MSLTAITIAPAIALVNSTRFDSARYRRRMNIRETRLQRLQELLDQRDGIKLNLAKDIKKAPAQVSQWFNGTRTISEDSARAIELELKLPRGWMDTPPASRRTGVADSGAIRYSIGEPTPESLRWPFPRIDQRAVLRLTTQQIRDLETAMLVVASQAQVRIQKRNAA